MASSFSDQPLPGADISGTSPVVFFLRRALESVRRGNYAEGATFLSLAREQLSPDEPALANAMDPFIQQYANYQRTLQALQEITARFSEAYAGLQAQAARFAAALPALLGEVEKIPLAPRSPTLLPQVFPEHPTHAPGFVERQGHLLPDLSITCFGRFEVRRSGNTVTPCSSRNGQSILRYLVAKLGHYATSDALLTLFWPEDEQEVAQRKLHIAISALRHSLDDGSTSEPAGSYIVCKNKVYSLNPAATILTDIDEFLRCYQMGHQGSEEKIAFYERACRLYTGPFLVEDLYADWSFLQREHLCQVYLAMCRALTDHYLAAKRYEDATQWATAALQENRCEESAHRQLIQIYAAQGRRNEAIQQYQRCERVLREELGVQPLPETVQLVHTLLYDDASPGTIAQI